jgi:hypothetical protein
VSRERLRKAVWVGLVLLASTPPLAHALEPTTVQVEGTALIDGDNAGAVRDLAFNAAMLEAVLEVARLYVPSGENAPDEQHLRELLKGRAPGYVLTYRIHGSPKRRRSAEFPGRDELVLGLTATVDAGQVRQALEELGVMAGSGDRPSVVLRVRGAAPTATSPVGLYNGFAEYLARALVDEGYVIVDPALHPGGGLDRGALELAQTIGADVSIDVAVSWLQREVSDQLVGGTAEVRLRAQRARDGSDLARARFQAPAYHQDADEALLRSLEALRGQVADNLLQQLDRNWTALARDDGPVRLQLVGVTAFRQVESVRSTLTRVLGAKRADLLEVGPGSAELGVSGPLTAGALQDRLTAVQYEGFALEPLEVRASQVRLRVRATPAASPLDEAP